MLYSGWWKSIVEQQPRRGTTKSTGDRRLNLHSIAAQGMGGADGATEGERRTYKTEGRPHALPPAPGRGYRGWRSKSHHQP